MFIITHPNSVNVGDTINISWSQERRHTYSVQRQINSDTASWVSVPLTFQNRFNEPAQPLWNQVRYRVTGIPDEPGPVLSSTTGWITIIGGVDPDPPDPELVIPTVLTPTSVTPEISFQINWVDSNGTTATYDLEESVNEGSYTRIVTSHSSKSFSRTPARTWTIVKYRVRAKRDGETTNWGYSSDIAVNTIFPKMQVKIAGQVRDGIDGWVKVNGTLRKITDMWVMVNGTLRKS